MGTDPAVLAGLLADADRRLTFAALVLGATTLAEVRDATGLDARAAGTALSRLVEAGIAVHEKGAYAVVEAAFTPAPRAAADATEKTEVTDPVLRAFVRDGRLVSIPASKAKRRVVLDLLAQEFEPGQRYPERTVNEMLRRWHDDVAALRRYLVDEEFLDREAGIYWRCGGTTTS